MVSDTGCLWRWGLLWLPTLWQVFRSSEAVRIFWMSSRLLHYYFICGAWTNYFNSSLQWGADWQLPSSEWSVCFVDEAIWCILTIIGATATMMFGKPLCYFPRGCPWGIFKPLLGLQRRLQSQDRWEDCCPPHIRRHHDTFIIIT